MSIRVHGQNISEMNKPYRGYVWPCTAIVFIGAFGILGTLIQMNFMPMLFSINTNVKPKLETKDYWANSSRVFSGPSSDITSGPSDWILTSYMRSGSSFTSHLLGKRNDTFFWFEPLFAYHIHFWSDDKVCFDQYDRGNCRKPKVNEATTYLALTDVQRILDCNLTGLIKFKNAFTRTKESGDNWKIYEQCTRQRHSPAECLKMMETVCRTAIHRGIKLLRLTLNNVGGLLESNPRLKIVHLFRDPRAVLNSRITTNWYDFGDGKIETNVNLIIRDADFLCKRMSHEAKAGIALRQKYPDRFGFVLYEDLLSDLTARSKLLFDFLGIQIDEPKKVKIEAFDAENHLVNKKNDDFVGWWREQLKFELIRNIDMVCKGMYDLLGYIPIDSKETLLKSSTPAYNLNKEFLLDRIASGKSYNVSYFPG